MRLMSLFNGSKFPDFIFNEKCHILFFEFYACFSDEFVTVLKEYLENVGVTKITIKNIEPEALVFNQTIEVKDLPESFNLAAKTMMTTDYISSGASLYIYTELTEIYDPDNNNPFSLVLDRGYDLGIMGLSSKEFTDAFKEFEIDDVPDYLSLLNGSFYTDAMDNKIRANYLK